MSTAIKHSHSNSLNYTNATLSRGPKSFSNLVNSSSNDEAQNKNGVNVKVILRCRPVSELERKEPSHFSIVTTKVETKEVCISQTVPGRKVDSYSKTFTFDGVCSPQTSQSELFKLHIVPIVEEVLLGFNCTIFAYGQTGTGKTYTMEGDLYSKGLLSLTPRSSMTCSGNNTSPQQLTQYAGLIPRAVQHIFERLEAQEAEYSVRVSYLEIYNEELHDLLNDGEKQNLRIYEDTASKKGLSVDRLEELPVNNPQDIYNILSLAVKKRRTAETLLNRQSSRSHCIFSVTIHLKEANLEGEDVIKIGKLNLVDLAGSENIQRSGANVFKDRAKEAGMINQSLLTLGRVINALVERSSYIPYRDSKLTRLLQESLGGRTKTCIVATISPSSLCLEETLSTLDYAFRAKNIRNRPEVNQKLAKRVVIRELNHEIERLKLELLANREKNGVYLPLERYNHLESLVECQSQDISNLQSELSKAKHTSESLSSSMGELKKQYEESVVKHERLMEENQRLEAALEQKAKETVCLEESLSLANTSVGELEEQLSFLLNTLKTTGYQLNVVGSSLSQCQALGYQLVIQMDREMENVFECMKQLADQLLRTAMERFREKSQELDATFHDIVVQAQKDYKTILSERINPSLEKTNKIKESVNRDLSFCLTEYLNYFKQLFTETIQTFTRTVHLNLSQMNDAVNQTSKEIQNLSQTALLTIQEFQSTTKHLCATYREKIIDHINEQRIQLSLLHETLSQQVETVGEKIRSLENLKEQQTSHQRQFLQSQLTDFVQQIQKAAEQIMIQHEQSLEANQKASCKLYQDIAQHILEFQKVSEKSLTASEASSNMIREVESEAEALNQTIQSFCDQLTSNRKALDTAVQSQHQLVQHHLDVQYQKTQECVSHTFPRVLQEASKLLENKVLGVMEKTDALHSTVIESQNEALKRLESTLATQQTALEAWRKEHHQQGSAWINQSEAFYEAVCHTQTTFSDTSQMYRNKAHDLFQNTESKHLHQTFSLDDTLESLPYPNRSRSHAAPSIINPTLPDHECSTPVSAFQHAVLPKCSFHQVQFAAKQNQFVHHEGIPLPSQSSLDITYPHSKIAQNKTRSTATPLKAILKAEHPPKTFLRNTSFSTRTMNCPADNLFFPTFTRIGSRQLSSRSFTDSLESQSSQSTCQSVKSTSCATPSGRTGWDEEMITSSGKC